MSYLETVGMIVLLYILVYSLVDRICKCVVNVRTLKSFEKYMEQSGDNDLDEEED